MKGRTLLPTEVLFTIRLLVAPGKVDRGGRMSMPLSALPVTRLFSIVLRVDRVNTMIPLPRRAVVR